MVRDYAIDDAARALDQEQTLKWIRGWNVIDPEGGSNEVTAGTGNFEYDAAAGDINAGGTTVTCSLETVDFQADIDPSNDKLAVIYRDAAGTLQKAVGSGGTRNPTGDDVESTFEPPAPTLSNTDAVILAEVLLPAGASSIGATELHDRRDPVTNTDTKEVLNEGTVTLSGNSTPALDTVLTDVLTTETQDYSFTLYVDADPAFNADYAFNYDYSHAWDDSDSGIDIDLTVNWDTDPGGGNDVTARWEVYA